MKHSQEQAERLSPSEMLNHLPTKPDVTSQKLGW
jgi:hypothetical protein